MIMARSGRAGGRGLNLGWALELNWTAGRDTCWRGRYGELRGSQSKGGCLCALYNRVLAVLGGSNSGVDKIALLKVLDAHLDGRARGDRLRRRGIEGAREMAGDERGDTGRGLSFCCHRLC